MRAVVTQTLQLGRVLQQREQPVADEVRGRLETGTEQEDDGTDQLVMVELVTLLLDVDELGEQVVSRLGAARLDQRFDVFGDDLARARCGVELIEWRIELEGLHRVAHERLEGDALRCGNAQHLADDGHRQRQRELGNDVDRVAELVEQLIGEPHDFGPEVLDRLGCERLRHEPAQTRVVGRIEAEHRAHPPFHVGEALAPLLLGQAVGLPHRADLALAETRVAQHPLAVFEAADDHEAQGAAKNRRVLADRRVTRVGIRFAFGRQKDLCEQGIYVDFRRVGHRSLLAEQDDYGVMLPRLADPRPSRRTGTRGWCRASDR